MSPEAGEMSVAEEREAEALSCLGEGVFQRERKEKRKISEKEKRKGSEGIFKKIRPNWSEI